MWRAHLGPAGWLVVVVVACCCYCWEAQSSSDSLAKVYLMNMMGYRGVASLLCIIVVAKVEGVASPGGGGGGGSRNRFGGP